MEVGEMLENVRQEAGVSQEALGELYRAAGGTGSNGTVEAWLRGWREPRVSQYDILAGVLNDLIGEELLPQVVNGFTQMSYFSDILRTLLSA